MHCPMAPTPPPPNPRKGWRNFSELEALKASLISSAASTTESASSALSSRTNGPQHSHPTHSSSASDSSNGAIVPPEAFATTSLQPATPMAGNSPQAAQSRAQNNSPISDAVTRANANSSREAASDSDSASRAQSPAVSGAPARSNPLAVSGKELSAIAEPSSSAASATGSLSAAVPATPASGEGSPNSTANSTSSTLCSRRAPPWTALQSRSPRARISRPRPPPRLTKGQSPNPTPHPIEQLERLIQLNPPCTHRAQNPRLGLPHAAPISCRGTQAWPSRQSVSLLTHWPPRDQGPGTVPGSNLGSVSASSITATAASPGETFAALDGDAPGGSINWTHAGAHRAEAGFEDPALGWVGVRADVGGGSVHVSLVPGSAEAAQMLGGHLAGLNDYLAERHPDIGIVTVAGHEGSGSFTNAQSGSGNESGNSIWSPILYATGLDKQLRYRQLRLQQFEHSILAKRRSTRPVQSDFACGRGN